LEVKAPTICPTLQNGLTGSKKRTGDANHLEVRAEDLTQWPLNFPTRDLRELSDDDRNEAAYIIARRLLQVVEGDVGDPDAWERYATEQGFCIELISDVQQPPGRYVPPEQPEGASGIRINGAFDRQTQARAWVHELAHDALWRWIPIQLRHAADAQSYDGEVQDVQHDIARRVERVVFGS
jgi:hypothetical protein